MIGSVIAKIRKDKNISKTDLAKITNIDIGHLTHIEKEERNPSHKTLKAICSALEVPIHMIMTLLRNNLDIIFLTILSMILSLFLVLLMAFLNVLKSFLM